MDSNRKAYTGTLLAEFQEFMHEMQAYKNEIELQGEIKQRIYGHKVIIFGHVRKTRTPFRLRIQIWSKKDVEALVLWLNVILEMCSACIGKDLQSDSE